MAPLPLAGPAIGLVPDGVPPSVITSVSGVVTEPEGAEYHVAVDEAKTVSAPVLEYAANAAEPRSRYPKLNALAVEPEPHGVPPM